MKIVLDGVDRLPYRPAMALSLPLLQEFRSTPMTQVSISPSVPPLHPFMMSLPEASRFLTRCQLLTRT